MIESISDILQKQKITENTEQEKNFLDNLFSLLGIIPNNPLPMNFNPNLIKLRFLLKNNQFEEANLLVGRDPLFLKQMISALPITMLYSFFKFLLRKRLNIISEVLWENGNSTLARYFNGHQISVAFLNEQRSEEERSVFQITIHEWVENFKTVLMGNSSNITSSMLTNNPAYVRYFIGQNTLVATSNTKNIMELNKSKPDLSNLITNFKYALFGTRPNLAIEIWSQNVIIIRYCVGTELVGAIRNINNYFEPKKFKISFEDMLAIHDRALKIIGAEHIASTMNICLRNLYIYSYNNFQQEQNNKIISSYESESTPPLLSKSIQIFTDTLKNNNSKEKVKRIWDENPQLQNYFTNKETLILENKKHDESVIITKIIPITDLIQAFKDILKKSISQIIEPVWKNNEQLRDYLCAKEILIPAINKSYSDSLKKISPTEQLEYFELALQSRNQSVINGIWDNDGLLLQKTILELKMDELIKLTMQVLSSNKTNNPSKFIRTFLDWILVENISSKNEILEQALLNMQKKLNEARISTLKDYINKLSNATINRSLTHTITPAPPFEPSFTPIQQENNNLSITHTCSFDEFNITYEESENYDDLMNFLEVDDSFFQTLNSHNNYNNQTGVGQFSFFQGTKKRPIETNYNDEILPKFKKQS